MIARFAAIVTAGLLVLAASQSASAANRYDPRFRFRSITTPRFTVYFHQGEERRARRLAIIAEEVADRVARDTGTPNGRVHVILVDQSDLSNGWAIPAPYNMIEISLAVPPGDSSIGNTDDWLRLVFSHEYTHIVHLDKARGWIGGLRRVFGRAPVLYPNLFLPLWQIEGIATYAESVLTGEGRVPAGDFKAILNSAAVERRFDPLDRVNGGLVDWPSGAAQYVYGAYFHQYLADRFGPESIARLADETSGRVPYFGARAFRKVFGRSLGALWNDFEADARSRAPRQVGVNSGVRVTHHGFSVATPAYGQSGRLFYSVANPHGFPSLMELPRDGSASRRVATMYLGNRIAAAGGFLVFDQVEVVNHVALQSDLYLVSEDGGPVRRLTARARAADPDVSRDGRTVVCTVQSVNGRALTTFRLPPPGQLATPETLLAEADADFSSPRWSPDGRSIAAERRRVGGPSEIVVVDAATREVRSIVSSTRARNVTPFWSSDRTILFASDRDGQPFAIYSVDVVNGSTRRLIGTGPSAQSPAVSADGRELVYVGYTADGDDLFALPLPTASWVEVPTARTETAREAPGAAAASSLPDRPYRPWPTLAPQFWTPIIDSSGGEVTVGAATEGSDALGRHAYATTVAWAARARPDWSIAYAYDRWRPTLFAAISDDTDPWRDGDVRTREINVGASFAARHVRHSQIFLAAFNSTSDTFKCGECGTLGRSEITRRAIRLGWSFDASKSYGYSVSRESGASVRATWESAPEALGSDAGSRAVTVDARGYRLVGPRHAAVAVRAAAASAWGDPHARRVFSAAGAGPQTGVFDFAVDAIGLLRGLDAGDVSGNRAVVANLDYRFPLMRVQRGVGTIPVFFRTIHGAVFADAGDAWTGPFHRADVRFSAGAELSLDAVVGYSLPITFASGVAWRDDPVAARRGAVVFGRIGRAF